MVFTELFMAGVNAIIEYLSAHVLTCLIPAFFIAGAMSAFLPKDSIISLLGQKAPKYKAYPLAVLAGLLLAVCSCTVLPLFAGIKKRGAGIGPALAFLYTAPATNIVAILFTGSVLGWDFAVARILLSVLFAILIGLIISNMFSSEEDESIASDKNVKFSAKTPNEESLIQKYRLVPFFAILISILIVGTRVDGYIRYVLIGALVLVQIVLIAALFTWTETKEWLMETWMFVKKIFPLLLVGIFVAGVLIEIIPENFLATYMGTNTVFANLAAVLFGVFMYFPTLVEVPMASMFLELGVAKGPLLAYLLADPVISLASILVVRKFIGNKRTVAYVGLIILFATISGFMYGLIA